MFRFNDGTGKEPYSKYADENNREISEFATPRVQRIGGRNRFATPDGAGAFEIVRLQSSEEVSQCERLRSEWRVLFVRKE